MQHSPGSTDDEQPTPEEVAGRELRRLRVARGWSQEQVAEHMKAFGYDWHQTQVGRIESAQRPLRLNEAVDLAALFAVGLDRLLGPNPDMTLEQIDAQIADARHRQREIEKALEELRQLEARGEQDLRLIRKKREAAEGTAATYSSEIGALQELRSQAQAGS